MVTKAMKIRKKKPKFDHVQERIKKAVFNGQDISKINVDEYFSYQYLYFREMELESLDIYSTFPNLRVIDVSFNELRSLRFLKHMPSIKYVTATRNKLGRLESYMFQEGIEALSLGRNNITNFEGAESINSLKMLTLSNNQIENFLGYQTFVGLEAIDLRGNPVSEVQDIRLITIGLNSHAKGLKMINGAKITKEEKENAVPYGGKFALCVREGFLPDYTSDVDVKDQAAQYLIKKQKTNTYLSSVLELISIELLGNTTEGSLLTLVPVFKVRDTSAALCAPAFGMHTFRVESKEDHVQVIIKQLDMALEMEPLDDMGSDEYELTLLLPIGEYEYRFSCNQESDGYELLRLETPVLCDAYEYFLNITWLATNDDGDFDIIDEDQSLSYRCALLDVGCWVKGQLSLLDEQDEPYFHVFDISEQIQHAKPGLVGLNIVGAPQEGNTFEVNAQYFGGVEGESVIKWTGTNNKIITGPRYPLELADVGSVITVEYTPVRSDGLQGSTVVQKSDRIEAAPPSIQDIRIEGDLIEGEPLSLVYEYYGGEEGSSILQWLRFSNKEGRYVPIEGATTGEYVPILDDVHKNLAAVIVPVSDTGIQGDEEMIETKPIRPGHPSLQSLAITGLKLEQDTVVFVEAAYFGGYEGKSEIAWYRVKPDDSTEELIDNTQQLYKCRFDDLDHKLKVVYTPVRSDGERGDPQHFITDTVVSAGEPKCSGLEVEGLLMEDSTLTVEAQYSGGIEGESEIQWYRIKDDEKTELQASSEDGYSYKAQTEDVGCTLLVTYVPVRRDGAKGEQCECTTTVINAAAPAISNVVISGEAAEYEKLRVTGDYHGGVEGSRNYQWYRISADGDRSAIEHANRDSYIIDLDDITFALTVAVQPVRDDQVTGDWVFADPTKVVEANPPSVSAKIEGKPAENATLTLKISGDDLNMEKSTIFWYFEENGERHELGNEASYTIKLDDVGKKIFCELTPVRADFDVVGESIVLKVASIESGPPVASNVVINGDAQETKALTVSYDYEGGLQGTSKIQWYRIESSGNKVELSSEEDKSLVLTVKEVDASVCVEVTPIRDDDEVGSPVSTTIDKIVGADPVASDLAISGEARQAQVISASYTYFGGKEGTSPVTWFRVSQSSKVKIAENDLRYQIQLEDIGHSIVVEIVPVRNDSVKGEAISTSTSVVVADPPSVSNVSVQGTPIVSEQLVVSGDYYGGVEGKSEFVWSSAEAYAGPFTTLPEQSTTLVLTPHLLSQYVKVSYVPVRDDGTKGTPVETKAVQVNPHGSFYPNLTSAIGSVVNEVTSCTPAITLNNKQLIVKSSKKGDKYTLSSNMVLNITNDTTFTLTINNNTLNFTCNDRLDCFYTVCLISLYIGFSDVNLVTNMYGKDFATAWKKKKNVANAFEEATKSVMKIDNPGGNLSLPYTVMMMLLNEAM